MAKLKMVPGDLAVVVKAKDIYGEKFFKKGTIVLVAYADGNNNIPYGVEGEDLDGNYTHWWLGADQLVKIKELSGLLHEEQGL